MEHASWNGDWTALWSFLADDAKEKALSHHPFLINEKMANSNIEDRENDLAQAALKVCQQYCLNLQVFIGI